jgi:tRNA(Ile)-lysidine synthase
MVWTDLHSKLHKTLKQRSLLPPRERILIAVSGGQDSVCLLKLLLDLQSKWYWQLAIAHCDHGWSTDSGIADHVENLAKKWALSFYVKIANNLNACALASG